MSRPHGDVSLPSDLQEEINGVMARALIHTFTVSRREALGKGLAGVGGLLSLGLLGQACKSTSVSDVANATGPSGAPSSFLAHIAQVEASTPLPAPTDAGFPAAAKARGAAVAKTIGYWLATQPYAMFQELLDQPESTMPLFKPAIGPVIVMRHKHVIACLDKEELFTVDPYSREMKRACEGEFDQTKFGHFILGTDNTGLYDPDSVILRKVLRPDDMPMLRKIIRKASMAHVYAAKNSGSKQWDAVQTLCRFVPISVCDEYLGFPVTPKGHKWIDGVRKGGEEFDIDADLRKTYTFQKITKGKIPTREDLYVWIKNAFRNIFNNLGRDANFEALGIEATEYQVAYLHEVMKVYKKQIAANDATLPDNMVTRLLKMQAQAKAGSLNPADFGLKSKDELMARLTDARIRENVIGTVTGAGVNPEEGMARIVDAMLDLKDGKIKVAPGASTTFDKAVATAKATLTKRDETAEMKLINRYALEALRLNPQGEILLRMCVKDNTELAGVAIRQGTLVFASHGAAMRDPAAIKDPLFFNAERDPQETKWSRGIDARANELPQSQTYLQHGYGRHKCLGRYASEMTLEEGLRALLLLGDISRGSALKMDAQNLYAESLLVNFT